MTVFIDRLIVCILCRNEDTDTIDNNNEEQNLSDSELDNSSNQQQLVTINNNNNNNNSMEQENNNRNFDSVFSRIEHLLNGDKKNCGRSRSEGNGTVFICFVSKPIPIPVIHYVSLHFPMPSVPDL
jgi:hypothetical protein